jgi:hypothetical protein
LSSFGGLPSLNRRRVARVPPDNGHQYTGIHRLKQFV